MTFIAQNLTLGQLNAIVKKIGGEEKALKLLRDELVVIEPERLAAGMPAVVPATFETDSASGRITVKVKALGLSGEEWVARLEALKYRVSDYAKSVLRNPEYHKHRLEPGMEYTIALVRGTEIRKDRDRTTAKLRELGARDYGKDVHDRTKAELACLLREAVSDEQLEKWGIWYIAILHDPIADLDGGPRVLSVRRRDEGRWLDASWDEPGSKWGDDGAFGFPLPAK